MITSGELIIFHDLIMYITTFIYKKSIGVLGVVMDGFIFESLV